MGKSKKKIPIQEIRWDILAKLFVEKRVMSERSIFKVFKDLKVSDKTIAVMIRNFVRRHRLVKVEDIENEKTLYFMNGDEFYEPEELHALLPRQEANRIIKPLEQRAAHNHDREKLAPFTFRELAFLLYSDGDQGFYFLRTFFELYNRKGLIKLRYRKTTVALTLMGLEYGIDEQSLKTLEAREIEGQLVLTRKAALLNSYKSLTDIEVELTKDLEAKLVKEQDFLTDKPSFTLSFFMELLMGNQFSDLELYRWAVAFLKPEDVAIASGFMQGNFLGIYADKARTLSFGSGLNEVDVQMHAADLALKALEERSNSKVIYVQGDDDKGLALSYARMAHVAEGGSASFGFNTRTLSAEKKRRLDLLALYRKLKIQSEIILPYQYRIGRALFNANEVYDLIGVYKSEYRLIIEILVAIKSDFDYPKKYEEVVNVDALFGNVGEKRMVTPDSLIMNINNRRVHFIHNAQFSDITQYANTIQAPEALTRHFAMLGVKNPPFMTLTGHDERFFATHVGGNIDHPDGNWVVNLPGLQDTQAASRSLMAEFHSRILGAKHHRQNTVRREPVSPGIVQLEVLDDGRIRWRIFNDTIKRKLEENADKPEVVETLAFLQDVQTGSPTMCPELVLLYQDYALFHRYAQHLWCNGDIIHGNNYKQFTSESRFVRLVSVDAQKRFATDLITPFVLNAPQLKQFLAVVGNHEWNTFGADVVGLNNLDFLEFFLQGVLEARKIAGTNSQLKIARTVARINLARIEYMGGKTWVNWPYASGIFADTFKVAMSHMFKTGGSNPAASQMIWAQRMANAIDDLDMLLGGHYHSFWMTMLADKILYQAPGAATISGYEMFRGYSSDVMFSLFTFSNKTGIEIECIPASFLFEHYEPVSPMLKGRKSELTLPAPDSAESRHGKFSPYVESMIDNITWHIDV